MLYSGDSKTVYIYYTELVYILQQGQIQTVTTNSLYFKKI